MHETHNWKIKCQNESCSFMSLSPDELKTHEKQSHVFIGNYENQPHGILLDHDYTSKTAYPIPKNLKEAENNMILSKVDAFNDGTSKDTLVEDDTEESVLDAIDHTRDAIEHTRDAIDRTGDAIDHIRDAIYHNRRCNICNLTFSKKSRFDDITKHFADIHDIHDIREGECIRKI